MGAAPATGQPAQRSRQRQQSRPGASQGQAVTHHTECKVELVALVLADVAMPAHVGRQIYRSAQHAE